MAASTTVVKNAAPVTTAQLRQYGLTPAQLRQMVSSEVAAQLAPTKAAIQQGQKTTDAQFGQREQAVKNLSVDYANLLKGIGPQVQADYGNAANAIADFGRGFSGAVDQQAQKGEQATNGLLSVAGAPSAQVGAVDAHMAPPADPLYGMRGAIPAGALTREGAAFTAAADMLPGFALGRGQQNELALSGQQEIADEKYRQELGNLLASVPGLRATAQDAILKNARADQAENLLLSKYGLQSRTEVGNLTGVDPVTGKPTFKATQAQQKAQQAAEKARASAIERRDKAHAKVFTTLGQWIHNERMKRGAVVVGHEPITRTDKLPGGASEVKYLLPNGTYVPAGPNGAPPKNAVMKPVYDEHGRLPLNYGVARSYVLQQLRAALGAYGYTPAEFSQMVDQLLGPPPPPPPAPLPPISHRPAPHPNNGGAVPRHHGV